MELCAGAFNGFQVLLPGGELLLGSDYEVDPVLYVGYLDAETRKHCSVEAGHTLKQFLREIGFFAETKNFLMKARDNLRRQPISQICSHRLAARFVCRC